MMKEKFNKYWNWIDLETKQTLTAEFKRREKAIQEKTRDIQIIREAINQKFVYHISDEAFLLIKKKEDVERMIKIMLNQKLANIEKELNIE